ncbi:MAG: D-aminoacyl-tRNA deacylase [Proteobacteria bacterium]|nr:D-aminoacyl-tRNA deacylase [Pseudomonadota bacterium]
MIALIQRVNWARVTIEKKMSAEIAAGLLGFIGIEKEDTRSSADKLIDKILAYRVFADSEGKMNLDLKAISGDLLLVSQFTLVAATDKGLRPSFSSAKPPHDAEPLYEYLVVQAKLKHRSVASGQFAANMQIALENDGPVTLILKS